MVVRKKGEENQLSFHEDTGTDGMNRLWLTQALWIMQLDIMNKTETNIQRWSRCRGYKSKLEKRNFHAQRYRKRRGSFYAFQNFIKWNAWLPTVICLLSWQRLYSLLVKHAFSCSTVVNVTSSNTPVRGLHGEFKGSRLAHQLHTDWQNESSKVSVQAVKVHFSHLTWK